MGVGSGRGVEKRLEWRDGWGGGGKERVWGGKRGGRG